MIITRLTVNIRDITEIETKDMEDHTAKDHNTEDIIKVIIKTRPERNIMFITKRNIGL
jgi:hypothetical protein